MIIPPPDEIGGPTIYDSAADLALSNPTPALGQQVVAYDVPMVAYGDGVTAWADLYKIQRPPLELAHSDSDTVMSGITSEVDVTDLAPLTFTVAEYPVYVVGDVPSMTNSHATVASVVTLRITDGSNVTKRRTFLTLVAGASGGRCCLERISAPGEYTRKLRVQKAGGTLALGIDATTVTEFFATEHPVVL